MSYAPTRRERNQSHTTTVKLGSFEIATTIFELKEKSMSVYLEYVSLVVPSCDVLSNVRARFTGLLSKSKIETWGGSMAAVGTSQTATYREFGLT